VKESSKPNNTPDAWRNVLKARKNHVQVCG